MLRCRRRRRLVVCARALAHSGIRAPNTLIMNEYLLGNTTGRDSLDISRSAVRDCLKWPVYLHFFGGGREYFVLTSCRPFIFALWLIYLAGSCLRA